jgi:hypothetical protein
MGVGVVNTLSLYYHVLRSVYRDRVVIASIYYTVDDELVAVEPIPMDRLSELVERPRTWTPKQGVPRADA